MASKSREQRVADSRDAAIAVVEDFDYLKILSETAETSPVGLRHASSIVRRWLVDGTLQRVSSPRIDRIKVRVVDNNPVYCLSQTGKIRVFVSGGALVHGVEILRIMDSNGRNPPPTDSFYSCNLINLQLKDFIKQRVIYTQGEWLTRSQVVKFVANVDHGVHSGRSDDHWKKLLSNFRFQVSVQLETGPDGNPAPSIVAGVGAADEVISPQSYDPRKVNGVLLELLATIGFLISSPDVEHLIEVIRAEM